MAPWYKVVTPRKEVREGLSFNPDEFAITLEFVEEDDRIVVVTVYVYYS